MLNPNDTENYDNELNNINEFLMKITYRIR